jgi:hypothetical protein
MSIEAMKQALEALEYKAHGPVSGEKDLTDRAITALRTAIEQAKKQEPVAWVNHGENRITRVTGWDGYGALYTTPPAAPVREPLFLLHTGQMDSDGMMDDWDIEADSGIRVDAFCAANPGKTVPLYTTPLAAPVQEPCQYAVDVAMPEHRCVGKCQYAAQRQWVSLTDEEIMEVNGIHDDPEEWPEVISEARAIEAKLREKNGGQA